MTFFLSKTKKEYFNDYIKSSENKTKVSWKVWDSLTNKKDYRKVSFRQGDYSSLSDDFNKFFAVIPVKITQGLSKSTIVDFRRRIDKSFFMFDITHDEVLSSVKSLKNKISWGHDEIPMKVIEASINCVLEPLTFIINRSFKEGVFPDNLKVAIMKPLHKKSNVNDLNNYRPINILSSFPMVSEKILCNRSSNFFSQIQCYFCVSTWFCRKWELKYY